MFSKWFLKGMKIAGWIFFPLSVLAVIRSVRPAWIPAISMLISAMVLCVVYNIVEGGK